jgi:hypothetical protein
MFFVADDAATLLVFFSMHLLGVSVLVPHHFATTTLQQRRPIIASTTVRDTLGHIGLLTADFHGGYDVVS